MYKYEGLKTNFKMDFTNADWISCLASPPYCGLHFTIKVGILAAFKGFTDLDRMLVNSVKNSI